MSVAEIQEMRRKFEQEHLARLTQKDKGRADAMSAPRQDLDALLIIEKGKTHEEMEKAKSLARQLETTQRKLDTISAFYKEQIETLQKNNLENYHQTVERFSQAADETEAYIRPRLRPQPQCTETACSELQGRMLQCYRGHPQQSLLCSGLAQQYMSCAQQAKKNQAELSKRS